MKTNMGSLDRVIRAIIAVLFGILYYMGIISGTVGIILVVAGAVFLLTSIFSFCPIYAILGMNTCAVKEENKS